MEDSSPDGVETVRSFYFSQAESAVKSVELRRAGEMLEPRAPTTLFTIKLVPELWMSPFNVTGDGQRFLIQVASGPQLSRLQKAARWRADRIDHANRRAFRDNQTMNSLHWPRKLAAAAVLCVVAMAQTPRPGESSL